MSAELMFLVALAVAAAVGGFWLSHHIHQVANAAARAVTIPSGTQAVITAAAPAVGAALNTASTAAQGAVADAATKAGG